MKKEPNNCPPEHIFLKDLFLSLSSNDIDYCVLRDYQKLPFSTDGHDIDMLIRRDDINDLIGIIRNISLRYNGRLITSYDNKTVIFRMCGYYKEWWGVAIDLIPFVQYRNFTYYSEKVVLSNTNLWRGILVAADKDDSMISFLKECLANGRDRKGYADKARNSYLQFPGYYTESFQKYFGMVGANELDVFFRAEFNTNSMPALKKHLRRNLMSTSLKGSLLKNLVGIALNSVNRLSRLIRPPGYTICVLGTDGSGKSTVINQIQPILEHALHSKIVYRHMRPGLVPSLAVLFGKKNKHNSGPVSNPHGSNPSSQFASLLRLTYYSIDYIVGYWVIVRVSLAKGPGLWVFDRYFYDYLIDPKRGRINLPQWLIKLFAFFIPKPDLVLCLGAEPEVIHGRKPELPLPEVRRQVRELRNLCERTSNAVWIDTGTSLAESADQALVAITTAMAARYEN